MSKLNILNLTLGPVSSNCYLISSKDQESIIIDPGDESDKIIQTIENNNLKPRIILLTHGHFDHILAAKEIQTKYKIEVLAHPDDQFLIDDLEAEIQKFIPGYKTFKPPQVNYSLLSNSSINYLDYEIKLLHLPGHSPGSVGFYFPHQSLVFSGDVIFAGGGIGRYDFPYASYADLKTSINKILDLPTNTIIYSGHGSSTSVTKEMIYYNRL
jgi:hydroxyacylglutathione hydrolase